MIIDQDYFSIWKYSSGWTSLYGWTNSGDINTGTAWNRLKVVRDDSSIKFYINDQLQVTVSDSSFTGLRRIGLLAYSPLTTPMDARFDDFALYQVSCGDIAAAVPGIDWGEAEAYPGIPPPKPQNIE